MTPRGEAVTRAIRATVREIEEELEAEMGAERFAELKRGLAELNATAFVQRRGAPARRAG
jgi:hypothetical protein